MISWIFSKRAKKNAKLKELNTALLEAEKAVVKSVLNDSDVDFEHLYDQIEYIKEDIERLNK